MALSVQYWAKYTDKKVKIQRKSENAVESGHILKFLYDSETKHVSSVVQASMKDKSYRVAVSQHMY